MENNFRLFVFREVTWVDDEVQTTVLGAAGQPPARGAGGGGWGGGGEWRGVGG